MKHMPNYQFWKAFDDLPDDVRELAKKSFSLLKQNPWHPSVRFKRVGAYWAARVGLRYRALAVEAEPNVFVWFWIGPHDEYDRQI